MAHSQKFFDHQNLLQKLNLSASTPPTLQQWQKFLKELEFCSDKINSVQTELEKSKAQVLSASKLSSVGKMTGGIAHEVNTPLAIIQMRTEQLLDQANENNFDLNFSLKALKSIDVAVRRIANTIRNLRAFARDGSDDPVELTSVKTIIDQTFSLCREKFTQHGIELSYIAEIDFNIETRANEFSQVLFNLLMNSYDAIEAQTEKWIKVYAKSENQNLHIEIIDSGLGIPSTLQEKVMEPFFSTKNSNYSTGLGLSISKSIIESYGGQISIDQKSKNTCFVLKFPLTEVQSLAG